jgi:hypothetical protein
MNVYSVYEESLELILPEGAVCHGVSPRSQQVMIWTSGDQRVLGLHAHAAFNTNFMHELVVPKLYENGKIDNAIKSRFIEDIYDTERPIMRHTLLKVMDHFLRSGS